MTFNKHLLSWVTRFSSLAPTLKKKNPRYITGGLCHDAVSVVSYWKFITSPCRITGGPSGSCWPPFIPTIHPFPLLISFYKFIQSCSHFALLSRNWWGKNTNSLKGCSRTECEKSSRSLRHCRADFYMLVNGNAARSVLVNFKQWQTYMWCSLHFQQAKSNKCFLCTHDRQTHGIHEQHNALPDKR